MKYLVVPVCGENRDYFLNVECSVFVHEVCRRVGGVYASYTEGGVGNRIDLILEFLANLNKGLMFHSCKI